MGEVERIRASLGAAFGHDLGQRVTATGDRQAKKHHQDPDEHAKDDALDLHSEDGATAEPVRIVLPFEPSDHLDLSA